MNYPMTGAASIVDIQNRTFVGKVRQKGLQKVAIQLRSEKKQFGGVRHVGKNLK
jgi:RNA polymerase-interacting CarD/CdnL/TRCF family regulator